MCDGQESQRGVRVDESVGEEDVVGKGRCDEEGVGLLKGPLIFDLLENGGEGGSCGEW